jgi:hypothetical protein
MAYKLSLRRRSGTICNLKWRTIHQGTTWRLGRGIAFPQLGHLPRPIKTLNPSCISLPHPSHIGGCENSSTISDAFDIGSAILYGWPSYKTPSLAESTAVRLARLSPYSPDGTHLGPTAHRLSFCWACPSWAIRETIQLFETARSHFTVSNWSYIGLGWSILTVFRPSCERFNSPTVYVGSPTPSGGGSDCFPSTCRGS